ncbi:MAG: nucleotidyl transferase AbiEii/AbiGii toxin family protein [Bdellovibrionaceae bacterium]|nr:nucleotidyl transferase AbiEii/AbiGii toxin family protein [Pseudobdellovibrionaceae bacterium]
MFEREHHVRIATILQSLDAELLGKHGCFFGGGTAIVLFHQEYRESLDIDFLVSDRVGYQTIRNWVTGERGIQTIVRTGAVLIPVRDIRADQYGIRTILRVGSTEIKFEIVLESRIDLQKPRRRDHICGIKTLTHLDLATSKLLANSDRWSDDAVFSRDLIDLAMLEMPRTSLSRAIEKARAAYGESVERDLGRSIRRLAERPGRLDECMDSLKMDRTPKALLWKRISRLSAGKL